MAMDTGSWTRLILGWIIVVSAIADQGPVLYGSDESLPGLLQTGGRRSWLDPNVELTAGTVLSVVAYIGDLAEVKDVTLAVRFQVWTRAGEEHKLKWEKRVEVLGEGNRKMTFELSQDELVDVTENDHIGFTCEQEICPVAYQNTPDYSVQYHTINAGDFPPLGQQFNFGSNFDFPAKFAFGVYIGTPQFGSVKYSGNPVVAASTPENTGQRAWIDKTVSLSSGLVHQIEFYAAQTQGTNLKFMVQLWLPKDNKFELLWQHEVSVDQGEGKYTIEVPPHESVVVNSSCHLGWTFPDKEGPIYYTFDGSHTSQFYPITDQPPAVGEAYEFDLTFPHRFSIGLWIDEAVSVVPPPPNTAPPHLSSASPDTTEVPSQGGSTSNSPLLTGVTLRTLLLMTACGYAL